ncbi:hypothetical protein K502DRAFT_350147 [Neoconidiobolus thromboides FSU 785]|nr:hypothetical protein K502DRAFT_350147 [Neoconidiobolus thromboides FSU 785]
MSSAVESASNLPIDINHPPRYSMVLENDIEIQQTEEEEFENIIEPTKFQLSRSKYIRREVCCTSLDESQVYYISVVKESAKLISKERQTILKLSEIKSGFRGTAWRIIPIYEDLIDTLEVLFGMSKFSEIDSLDVKIIKRDGNVFKYQVAKKAFSYTRYKLIDIRYPEQKVLEFRTSLFGPNSIKLYTPSSY